MIIIKNAKQIAGIKKSSLLAAQTLKYLSEFVKPGISTQKLNDLAHQYILDHGATPAPLNYGTFPKSICSSVNDVVCHGIPSPKLILKEGDIINLDITTILDSYYGDTSATFPVGKISPEAANLIKVTQESLYLAIKSLKPGKYLNECVGAVIEPYVQKYGYSVVRDLGGHGVGLRFHEDPFVFHFNTDRRDVLLQPGMIFTIEPMVNDSPNSRIKVDSQDGWTVTTVDGSLSAQFEHTVLITKNGSQILTKL